MKALTSPAPNVDELASTGLRQVAPQGALENGPPPPTASQPPDSWQADEGPESELPVPEGELLDGRYLVERIFAEGGMGVVCFGRHIQLEQPVAIKFLRRALAGRQSVVERFLNEGRALAALRSEHVVRVMDVGQLESGRPYLVMEHLEGIDLDALVDRDGPLSVETAISYALQVCEPLAEAHALGIVHRDIKPENLFLWSGGPRQDVVKVLDFGLAKQFGSPRAMAVTGPQDSIGSPCYMSPEQITTPQNIDTRTDIWSLGVVLHRLLTDTLPFDGNSILEVLSHVLSAAPKSLHDSRPELEFDPELDAIVQRCLEKDRDARYGTMIELSEALTTYLAHRREAMQSSELPASRGVPPVAVNPEHRTSAARVFEGDDEKIRIEGVHARWPWVLLVGLGLAAAGVYQADRTGRVRVRDLTDGRITPARMAADAPAQPRPDVSLPTLPMARGVFATEPTREADGTLTLRAEPELDSDAGADVTKEPAPNTPLSDAERVNKEAAYRAYLSSQGLTPLREVLKTLDTPAASD